MEKKKFRISGKLIFNLAVVAISIYLIIYFFVSEDGLIDLLKKPDGCNMLIILAALLIYDLNILVDAVVTLIYVRSKYENFSFILLVFSGFNSPGTDRHQYRWRIAR